MAASISSSTRFFKVEFAPRLVKEHFHAAFYERDLQSIEYVPRQSHPLTGF